MDNGHKSKEKFEHEFQELPELPPLIEEVYNSEWEMSEGEWEMVQEILRTHDPSELFLSPYEDEE